MAKDKHEHQPDSLLKTIFETIRLVLVIIGLTGLSIEIFRDDGILTRIFSGMISSRLGLASIPITLIVLFLLNRWLVSHSGTEEHSRTGDLPLYFMMSVGATFVFNFLADAYWPSLHQTILQLWLPIRHAVFGI